MTHPITRATLDICDDYGLTLDAAGYVTDPGRFERCHMSAIFYYDAMMNGASAPGCLCDPSFHDTDADEGFECYAPCDVLPIEPDEREAFGLDDTVKFAIIYISDQGFCHVSFSPDDPSE